MGTEVAAAAVLDDIDEDRMRAITAGSMAAAFTEAVEGMSWVLGVVLSRRGVERQVGELQPVALTRAVNPQLRKPRQTGHTPLQSVLGWLEPTFRRVCCEGNLV